MFFEFIAAVLTGMIVGFLYVLPAAIAYHRKHQQKKFILALTLLGGWTGWLWLVALVWSFTKPEKKV